MSKLVSGYPLAVAAGTLPDRRLASGNLGPHCDPAHEGFRSQVVVLTSRHYCPPKHSPRVTPKRLSRPTPRPRRSAYADVPALQRLFRDCPLRDPLSVPPPAWLFALPCLLNLKPPLRTISLRLPEALIARLKVLANKRDVPYQSLLKVLLAERLNQEEATQVLTLRPAQGRL